MSGGKRAGVRRQRIHGGINAEFRDGAFQHDGRVQVRERRGRRGVGQVVGGHIHGLEAGDRTFLGRGDAFLEVAHFGGERRLITDGARRAAQQRGHFRTRLREAENVVHEQEHVLIFFVAEIFGHGERGQRHAETRAGRFVHLAIDQTDTGTGLDDRQAVRAELRMALLVLLHLDDAGFDHFVVKIVAFARAFTDAGEHRDAAVQLRDVVDEFHDDDGLADAGAAERADFAALQERADEVNDLDAGDQHLRAGGLIHERRRGAMNGQILVGLDRALFVHGLAGHVEHAAHDGFADGHRDRRAGVGDFHAALEAFGAAHGDGANPVVAEVLLRFERQLGLAGARPAG